MFKKMLFTVSILPVTILASNSCNSTIIQNSEELVIAVNKMNDILKNHIKAKTSNNPTINNFVTLKNFPSLKDLAGPNYLGKYFDIVEPEIFIKELESNYNLSQLIKKIVIQPSLNSKNLKLIVYLAFAESNAYISEIDIIDALSSPFSYINEIKINVNKLFDTNNPKYISRDEFLKDWNKIKDNKNIDEITLSKILTKAFIFDDVNSQTNSINKLVTLYKNNQLIIKENNSQIILQLDDIALSEGYIFNITNNQNSLKYDNFIVSEILIV